MQITLKKEKLNLVTMSIKNKFPVILLYSGGIDSYVAWHYLGKPQTLYFDLNTRYSKKEKEVVRDMIPSTIIDNSLSFSEREHGENAYVPFRNLLLAAQANHYSDTIYIAGVADDNVSDKSEEAFLMFSNVLSLLEGRRINVKSPFWHLSKNEVVHWFLHNVQASADKLVRGISCYSTEKNTYCGKCPSCFRKWCALYVNGVKLSFNNSTLMDAYYLKASKEMYTRDRNKSIIQAVDDYRSRH